MLAGQAHLDHRADRIARVDVDRRHRPRRCVALDGEAPPVTTHRQPAGGIAGDRAQGLAARDVDDPDPRAGRDRDPGRQAEPPNRTTPGHDRRDEAVLARACAPSRPSPARGARPTPSVSADASARRRGQPTASPSSATLHSSSVRPLCQRRSPRCGRRSCHPRSSSRRQTGRRCRNGTPVCTVRRGPAAPAMRPRAPRGCPRPGRRRSASSASSSACGLFESASERACAAISPILRRLASGFCLRQCGLLPCPIPLRGRLVALCDRDRARDERADERDGQADRERAQPSRVASPATVIGLCGIVARRDELRLDRRQLCRLGGDEVCRRGQACPPVEVAWLAPPCVPCVRRVGQVSHHRQRLAVFVQPTSQPGPVPDESFVSDLDRRLTGHGVVIERQQARVTERLDHRRRYAVQLGHAGAAASVLGPSAG